MQTYISFRYSSTNCTAIAPSPTAEATRFVEPDRTSPAANTLGRLVSSKNGGRCEVRSDCVKAGPVRINPQESVSISFGSQSVLIVRKSNPCQKKKEGEMDTNFGSGNPCYSNGPAHTIESLSCLVGR